MNATVKVNDNVCFLYPRHGEVEGISLLREGRVEKVAGWGVVLELQDGSGFRSFRWDKVTSLIRPAGDAFLHLAGQRALEILAEMLREEEYTI